jgi:hypothetical protein
LETLPQNVRDLKEMCETRNLLSGQILHRDTVGSVWEFAVNREVEELSAETGFGRDTKEDAEDV